MSRVNELRAMRAKSWEEAKAFLDSKRNDKGMLNEEDTAIYEKMENDIVNLGREIEREERLNAYELRAGASDAYKNTMVLIDDNEENKVDVYQEKVEKLTSKIKDYNEAINNLSDLKKIEKAEDEIKN